LAAIVGCTPDMADQPRYEPLEASSFFADGLSARPRIAGTVARGELRLDDHFERGIVDGQPATTLPMEVDRPLLVRGQQRYNIFCSNCHDRTGAGQGMVVERGFPRPPSYHIDRLRGAPPGYIFDVITNGLGRMPEHGSMIEPADRWAIVAYLRTLQLSQHAESSRLTGDDLNKLQAITP
jgi:mono/diheme cytochrome c family protein